MMLRKNVTAVMACVICLGFLTAFLAAPAFPAAQQATHAAQDVHAYFNKLKARPEKVADYSLRDQAQIDKYRQGKIASSVTYDPARDTDPRKQDAAKVFIPADRVSLRPQVRVPIPETTDGTLLVTWDAWFGKEFAVANTQIPTFKNFQFSSGRIWTEVRALFGRAEPPFVAKVDVRQYGGAEKKGPVVDGVKYSSDTLAPLVASFSIMPETWTRYWVLIKPAGEWYEFSLWLGDENRDAVQIYNAARIKPNEKYWDQFWLEYNTSAHPAHCPARTGYFRNIVMLKDVPDVKSLLERPLGSGDPKPETKPAPAKNAE